MRYWPAWIKSWVLIALGVLIASHTVEGIHFDDGGSVLIVVLLVSLLNAALRPILVFLTLPFIILTFGLGVVVINAVIFLLVGKLVPGFTVDGFWPALWAAIVVGIVSFLVNLFLGGAAIRVHRGGPPGGGGRSSGSGKNGGVIDI